MAIASSFCARISRREASFSPNFHHSGGPDGRECQKTMGWQKHTVRGFMAGAMKKAGYTVESFKPDGGERTYRIKA
ncbi:MAG: DUF3489 domain-containing protein [Bryobacteraceae bacterium]